MSRKVSLGSNEIAIGLTEMLEQGFEEIYKHHQDTARVPNEAVSKMTIEIVFSTDIQRRKFKHNISRKMKLADRTTDTHSGTIFIKKDDEGNIAETFDKDPNQTYLEYDLG